MAEKAKFLPPGWWLDRFSLKCLSVMNLTIVGTAMSAVFAKASTSFVGTPPWSETTALAFWGITLLVAGATVRGLRSRSES